MVKSVIAVVSLILYFSPILAAADETNTCNTLQQAKCDRFCKDHQGAQSCIVDKTIKSGTCTCVDGASHTKNS